MTLNVIPVNGGGILDTDIEKTLGSLAGSQVISGLTPTVGSGLAVNVAAGTALIEGHWANDSAGTAVSVPASTSSSIWFQLTRNVNGFVTGVQYTVAATQPADSVYICDFVSGASSVSSVTDKRAFNPASINLGPLFQLKADSSSNIGIFLSGVEQFSMSATDGSTTFVKPIKSTVAQTTLAGTTAGSIIWSMPYQGSSYKKFIGFLNGYENTTTTAQTITFPTAFTQTPLIQTLAAGSVGSVTFGATATTTTLTLPTSMAAAVTGWIIVEGY